MKVLLVILMIVLGILTSNLPYFFRDKFTHNNAYDDDCDSQDGAILL